MNSIHLIKRIFDTMLIMVLLVGCNSPAVAPTSTPTAISPTATITPTLTYTPSPTSRIEPIATDTLTVTPLSPTATPKISALPLGQPIKICLVTAAGGINDYIYGLIWKGIQDAHGQLGTSSVYQNAKQESDYATNVNAFIQEKCNLIFTFGSPLGDLTKTVAQENPEQKFAIVDYCYGPNPQCDSSSGPLSNVLGLIYDSSQPSFLAGYLAAGMTKTGKVGTYSGYQIPTVTAFMDGFFYGVQYYNQQKSTSVQVIGWDPVTKTGMFAGTFGDQNVGITMGQTLLAKGADVILPVAGVTSIGTAIAVLANGKAWVIGVDTDWTLTVPEYQSVTLTSVMKNIDVSVYNAIKEVVSGKGNFEGGIYLGTLANNGVVLGTIASSVPDTLKAELEQVKAGIIAGTINIGP
jgi:basic membrane protein A